MTKQRRIQVLKHLAKGAATMFELKQQFNFDCDDYVSLYTAGLVFRVNGPTGVYVLTNAGRNYLALQQQEVA